MVNFNMVRLIAGIFTPDFVIGNKVALMNTVQGLMAGKFDGEVLSIPIPQDAPPEIPRLILSSKDDLWKLEVSLQRTNLVFFKPIDKLNAPNPSTEKFGELARDLFSAYKEQTNTRIQRMSFVTVRIKETNMESPTKLMVDKFCKKELLDKTFSKLSSLEMHSLKKYALDKFNINSWVRIRSTTLLNDTKTPILEIINDVNTYEEDANANFNKEDITQFFSKVPNHIENDILKLFL